MFQQIGNQTIINTKKSKIHYIKSMIQSSFILQTFDDIDDFEQAKILQIGLGGGELNAILAEKYPDVRDMNYHNLQ